MRRRTQYFVLLAIILAFVFTAPVASSSAPGAVILCSPGDSTCVPAQIHFTVSIDCYLLRAGPGQWIGVYYFDGELGIGCGPLVV